MTAAKIVDLDVEIVGFDVCNSDPRREAFDLLGPLATFVDCTTDQGEERKFPLVIELAGSGSSLKTACELVAPGGTVLAAGIPEPKPSSTCCDSSDLPNTHGIIVTRGATVHGVVSAIPEDFVEAIKTLFYWTRTRPDFLERIVTHRFPCTEFEKALAISPRDRIKVALSWE